MIQKFNHEKWGPKLSLAGFIYVGDISEKRVNELNNFVWFCENSWLDVARQLPLLR